MKDDQLSVLEDQARRVGRKRIPPEWRAEILKVALGNDEAEAATPPATPFKAIGLPEALERRVRRAERRTVWSMAACLVVSLFLIALLFRPKLEPRAAGSGTDAAAAIEHKLNAKDAEVVSDPTDRTELQFRADAHSGSFRPLAPGADSPDPKGGKTHPPLPPNPKPAPSVAEGGDATDEIDESNGGFLIREAAINDLFQMLAKRAGKQYFHNSKVAGPEFNVSGHLNGSDPMKQMEELAFMYGLSLHHKGDTVYALSKEQLNQLPSEKWQHRLRSLRPADVDQLKALIQPVLSPTGIVDYEPETRSVTIVDSAHKVDRARKLLATVDPPDYGASDRALLGRPLEMRSGVDGEGPTSALAAATGRISLIDRVPILATSVDESEVSNQVTEEVRYSVDTKDPVGDPATTREIGVTLGVTATLLSDGAIRMKMRPRSAQPVEEIVSHSGVRYSQVSESMLESVARVPGGHSVVLGGFYGRVKAKDDSKVPLLGDIPVINLFLKSEETIKEPPSLLFVATPTSVNNQVMVETKILNVNSSAARQSGVDWSRAGLPPESVGSINSILGIKGEEETKHGGP
ncbi:MAG: hypothetical protein GWO24_21990, partial [Akkermansiaceae bacterium]|nr:hypothetical protein [Akkermansiaceae bacterium]